MPTFRYRDEESTSSGVLYLAAGAIAGVAAGILVAQRFGGLSGVTARFRERLAAARAEMEPSARLAEYGHHHGEEFVHVLEGTLALELEGAEPRILEDGDSAYYSAERPHLFRNADDGRLLRLICVDSPPNL